MIFDLALSIKSVLSYFKIGHLYSLLDASVGTNVGDIGLWEVGSRERLVLRNFKVWDLSACSMALQVSLFFNNTRII